MMGGTLTQARFPQLPSVVRARWAPVYLSPILGSPERLVIAVVTVNEAGFHVEAANALTRLRCLYGRAAETALFAAEVALDELRGALAERGAEALRTGALVFSGVSIGEVVEGEARTLSALARTWMAALSSLYKYEPLPEDEEIVEGRDGQQAADRLPILVLEHVVSLQPTYSNFFSESIREHRQRRLSKKVAGIDIDFHGARFVANFSTLQAGSLAQGVDRVKRKMFDLKVTRDAERATLFGPQTHEMILFTPGRESPLLSEKQADHIEEALQELQEQSEREGFGLAALHEVPAIADRVVSAEAYSMRIS